MTKLSLKNMINGWFVGQFEPSVFSTGDVEVALKRYIKGDKEGIHHHRLATEITLVVSGIVKMNQSIYEQDDIILIKPYEATNFMAIEDAITLVVKIPGVMNDKYDGEYHS